MVNHVEKKNYFKWKAIGFQWIIAFGLFNDTCTKTKVQEKYFEDLVLST